MAWIAPSVDDFDGALRQASLSLEQLRGQDEPFWTALPMFTLGSLETAVGRYDDAIGHLIAERDLGERLDNAWVAASARARLGTVAIAQGQLQEARALLEKVHSP
jgi:ATP/maltotriose-dependent transcriptional regulator MalT